MFHESHRARSASRRFQTWYQASPRGVSIVLSVIFNPSHLKNLRTIHAISLQHSSCCALHVAHHEMGTSTDALRFVAATPRFRIGQIDDGLPDASKLVLIRRLIREGLLQCSPGAG